MTPCGRRLPPVAGRASAAVAALLLAVLAGPAGACDLIILNATSGGFAGPLLSRALEGGDFKWASSYQLVARPRGSPLPLYPKLAEAAVAKVCPDCAAETTADLNFVGVEVAWADFNIDLGVSADGMNEAGLSVSMLKLGRSQFPDLEAVAGTGKAVVWMLYLSNYILGKFSTVAEVKDAILNKLFVFAAAIPQGDHQHFSVVDRDGNSIVIEFMARQVQVYDNPVGVMTNDPGFPFHLENINAHPWLSATFNQTTEGLVVATGDLLPGIDYIPHGAGNHGWNLGGLPGDHSPASRFLRDFFYKQSALYVKHPQTRDEWLALATALLNSVFIAMGTAGEKQNDVDADHSLWGSLRLAQEGIYAVRTYWDPQWKSVNLNTLPFDRVTTLPFIQRTVPFVDITAQLAQQGAPPSLLGKRRMAQARPANRRLSEASAGGDAASLLQMPWEAETADAGSDEL